MLLLRFNFELDFWVVGFFVGFLLDFCWIFGHTTTNAKSLTTSPEHKFLLHYCIIIHSVLNLLPTTVSSSDCPAQQNGQSLSYNELLFNVIVYLLRVSEGIDGVEGVDGMDWLIGDGWTGDSLAQTDATQPSLCCRGCSLTMHGSRAGSADRQDRRDGQDGLGVGMRIGGAVQLLVIR